MNEFYAQAIDILLTPDLDHKSIVVALAKKHPNILVALVNVTPNHSVSWHKDVIDCVKSNNRVNAIKLIREKTAFGLAEAKDVYNALTMAMLAQGVPLSYIKEDTLRWYNNFKPLSEHQEKVYVQLCNTAGVQPDRKIGVANRV